MCVEEYNIILYIHMFITPKKIKNEYVYLLHVNISITLLGC